MGISGISKLTYIFFGRAQLLPPNTREDVYLFSLPEKHVITHTNAHTHALTHTMCMLFVETNRPFYGVDSSKECSNEANITTHTHIPVTFQ